MNNIEQYAELALRQLDNVGYYLSRYGISQKVNRHTLIAQVMTRRERIKGELGRMDLKVALGRKQLQQQITKISDTADLLIERTPKPVAVQLLKAKARVF